MDIYVDDVKATTWTSSGSTTAFENVELGVAGQTIELRGVMGDSEWLSITEVGAERRVVVRSAGAMIIQRGSLNGRRTGLPARVLSVTERAI